MCNTIRIKDRRLLHHKVALSKKKIVGIMYDFIDFF